MIGRGNTRRGAKRLFAVLQHTKLNQSLVHSIIDEVRWRPMLVEVLRATDIYSLPRAQLVFALFPEIRPPA